ncbi:MAG TPA: NAD(P)/FAD-dependent oxidoreductase [Bryobacteraceae bacterium]|nr:NAD(P)/FAD-dependent oxidoreductase [Bryobacteraceae bacterium]
MAAESSRLEYDVVIAGAGPAGLSAAFTAASAGASVLIVERNSEIGSPTRTSGGSFIRELLELGIPESMFHPIHEVRFLSPHHCARFEYDRAVACIIDVRAVYQHLAVLASQAGATIWLASKATEVLKNDGAVTGLRVETRTRSQVEVSARVVIDATGYRGDLLRQAGVAAGFQRFGVGAEFDLFAPHCNQREALLVVGSQFAPAGYGWVFPWGHHRVRVGVGVIHPDDPADPIPLLDSFIAAAERLGVDLSGAQPIEYHFGLIPSDMSETFVGDGILGVGDAAGHASTLVGEGIRWAIMAGRMAGRVAASAVQQDDASAAFLSQFQAEWLSQYGRNLRIANLVNRTIAKWDDQKWDEWTQLLALLSPNEFATALKTNFSAGWGLGVALSHPKLAKAGVQKLFSRLVTGS